MSEIDKARQSVLSRIAKALQSAGRSSNTCRLLAVSKTFPADAVRSCYASGQRAFGENYVQELIEKAAQLTDLPLIEWHFIGPLQSNKTRLVAEVAHWVHGVDRLKIAQRLSEQRPDALGLLNICVQVNVSGEASKSGCQPHEAIELAHAIAGLPRLSLRGLMCIPEPSQDSALLASQFASLRSLLAQLNQQGLVLDTLSMGMSADLEVAIAEGASIVRVGTALFGARH
ncbi:YggS family pyridoxal phosphate-dependent enzyme [Chitinimonas sp. BJB300]|uniref:YggS family pyridoxal phosphate-dependent enzyme n=1 Tax=Chitinimonas sp. BJB300 TaxID=1559339 RepID=UPI000C11D8AA|nr:YggS family pyridoxal phosphate-dependent enzyme [Chitinimonas sp. BJB300]PHV13202.1 YggS family pyridoxal phosphate-dependent enzyme [Chitinimonas sp. BJB300]TSJ89593.1 YggS family pyridoxal phosphate-dependent enzyme [Chitinimonas sp. BJB300]